MSLELNDLITPFKNQIQILLQTCEQAGYPMKPFFTLRSPFDQARLWRQSRPLSEINDTIESLKNSNADFLVYCLESVGPQNGRHVTNAIPGLSWHQWGEAIDCYWLLDDKAEWSLRKKKNGANGFHVYAGKAREMGLTPGGYWTSFKDWPHVQMRPDASPRRIYSLQQINDKMREMFHN